MTGAPTPDGGGGLTPEQRQTARHLQHMIHDALRLAETLAGRASEALDGTTGATTFDAVRRSIAGFRETSSALRAAFDLSLSPRDRE